MNKVTQWSINFNFPIGNNQMKTITITTNTQEDEARIEGYLADTEKKYLHIKNNEGSTLFWARVEDISLITRHIVTYSPDNEFKKADTKEKLWTRVRNSLLLGK